MALGVVGCSVIVASLVRELIWDHNRAIFHEDRAPKVIAHFNSILGLKLGTQIWHDSFDSAQSKSSGFLTQHTLLSNQENAGKVEAYGNSDLPQFVSLRYELYLSHIQKTSALKALASMRPELAFRLGDYKFRSGGISKSGVLTLFVYPSEDAASALKESGRVPEPPTKIE